MSSKEKSPFDLNMCTGKDDDDEESPLRFTRRKVRSTSGPNRSVTTSTNPHRTVIRRPGFRPLGLSKGNQASEVDEDQNRGTSNNSADDKEEGEWSDEEGSNNVKGEVLAPKRKEIRGPETMLGKKRSRQTMFLNLSDVKQAGPAKIPIPRRPNFLPPTTTRIPKDSQPLLDSGETMKDAKQFDENASGSLLIGATGLGIERAAASFRVTVKYKRIVDPVVLAQISSCTFGHLEVSELAACLENLHIPALLVKSKFFRICFSYDFKSALHHESSL
nr:helicase Sen1-like isoform X2 [Tanacetum cinerariifolium]